MSEITGREVVFGIKKATAWRQASACAAGDGQRILSESLGAFTITDAPDKSAAQTFITGRPNLSVPAVAGSLSANAYFVGADLIFALLGGSVATVQPDSTGAPNTYQHTISLAADVAGQMATIAVLKKTGTVWEVPTAKIASFELSGEIGSMCQLSVNVLGNRYDLASTVNTAATMANVTTLDPALMLFDANAVFRMNAAGALALSDTDKIYPRSFKLSFTRALDAEGREAGYDDISEPVETDFPNATLELTFDKYNTDAFFDAIAAQAHQKLDLHLTGGLIESTYNYDLLISCPNVKVTTGDAPVGGPGKIGHTATLQLDAATSAVAGMTDTKPFQAVFINTRTSL